MATELLTPSRQAPSPGAPARVHPLAFELIPFAALVVVAVGVPLAAAVATGAFHIPRGDDFAYIRVAISLHRTGHVHLVGWGEMMLIGHLLWGLPFLAAFGDSIAVLHSAGVAAAALGLIATYALSRQFLPPSRALLVTAAVGALSAYARLTPTYMTDITSYLMEIACLVVGIAALRARSRGGTVTLLGLSLLIGLWGFTVRESAIAAPAAVLAGHVLVAVRNPGRPARLPLGALLTATLSLAGAAGAAYAWRHSLPNDQQKKPFQPGAFYRIKSLAADLNGYYTLALALSPLLGLGLRGRLTRLRHSRAARAAALVVGGVGVAALAYPHNPAGTGFTVLLGGGLMRSGPALAGAPDLFPTPLWVALNSVAVLAGALLAGELVAIAVESTPTTPAATTARRHPARELVSRLAAAPPALAVLLSYGALSAILPTARTIGGYALYDRYFIGLVPVLGIVLLRQSGQPQERGRRRNSFLAPVAGLAALTLVSWMAMLDSNSFDTTRWSVARQVQRGGVPASQIGAGPEWVGAHLSHPLRLTDDLNSVRPHCVTLTGAPNPGPGLRLLTTRTYAPFDHFLERRIWVYRDPPLCSRPGPV